MTEQEQAIINSWLEAQETSNDIDKFWDLEHHLCVFIKPEFWDKVREVIDEDDLIESEDELYVDGFFPSFQWDDPVSDDAFYEWIAEEHNLQIEWIDYWSMEG